MLKKDKEKREHKCKNCVYYGGKWCIMHDVYMDHGEHICDLFTSMEDAVEDMTEVYGYKSEGTK